MKREQEGLLKLLKEIDTICKDNNIRYYVSGGTVIGAVRHEGFIPWDDDVDVYMTRDNWNAFREAFKKKMPEHRALECWEDNENFYNLLGRYMSTDTTQIHKFQLYGNAVMGQIIDMFVLDPMINDDEAIRNYQKDVMLASDLVNDFVVYSSRWNSCEEYAKLRDRMDREDRYAVIREVVSRLEQYEEAEADCYVLRWGGIPHVFPKEMFGEPKYLRFEDMDVPVPSKVCDYLTQLYGMDWMYIPPHEERIVHEDLFDFDQPYERFADVILPRIKSTETSQFQVERKKELFDNLVFSHSLARERRLLEGKFIKKKLITQIAECGADIDRILETNDTEEVRPLFKDYIQRQTYRSFIGAGDFGGFYLKLNPVFIDIGDDLLAVAMKIMIQDGRISKASRLMYVRETEVKRPLAPSLEKIRCMMEGLKRVQSLFEFHRIREAEEVLDSIPESERNQEYYKYRLEQIQRKDGNSSSEEFADLVDQCTARWPQDGDFYKYRGDAFFDDQDIEEALEAYTEMLLRSSNGLFMLGIRKSIDRHKDELYAYIRRAIKDNRHASEIVGAWRNVFESDNELMRLDIQTNLRPEDPFREILETRSIDVEKEKLDVVCNTYAECLGWKEGHVRFILSEEEILDPVPDLVHFNDARDISKYLNAVIEQKMGNVGDAYQMYLELVDSEDPYVSRKVREILCADYEEYEKRKEKGDDQYFLADYTLRYRHMPFKEYEALIKRVKSKSKAGSPKREEKTAAVQAMDNPWFKLLNELLDICEKNHIDYLLAGGIVAYLMHPSEALPYEFSNMDLIVDGKNAQKLIEACKELPPDRTLESVLTTPKMRNLDMFYTNTESTGVEFSTIDRRKSLGIAVPVRIARPQQKALKQKSLAKFDKLWRINYGYHFNAPKLTPKERKLSKVFPVVFGNGDRLTHMNFLNNLKLSINDDTKTIYIYDKRTRRTFSADLWKKRVEAELFGRKVFVPKNVERYIERRFHGRDPRTYKPAILLDEHYADHESEEEIYSNNKLWDKIEKRRRHAVNTKAQASEYAGNWDLANVIFEGINIEDYYKQEYDRLKGIYDKGAYTELLKQMKDYKKVLKMKDKYNVDIEPNLEQLYRDTEEKVSKL